MTYSGIYIFLSSPGCEVHSPNPLNVTNLLDGWFACQSSRYTFIWHSSAQRFHTASGKKKKKVHQRLQSQRELSIRILYWADTQKQTHSVTQACLKDNFCLSFQFRLLDQSKGLYIHTFTYMTFCFWFAKSLQGYTFTYVFIWLTRGWFDLFTDSLSFWIQVWTWYSINITLIHSFFDQISTVVLL